VAVASALPLALTSVSSLTLAVAVAATVPVSDADMRAATDRLLVEVGRVRRIAPRGAIERRVEARAEARARREAELGAAAADPELAARVRLWERLGLLPAGASPAHFLGAPLDAPPTASYDALGRRLAVPDWIPLPDQRPALAHALAHALADQRFGIRDLLGIDLEGRHHLDGDAERARVALVEGDAAVTALELDDPRGVLTGGHALPTLAGEIGAVPGPRAAAAWPRAIATFAHADGLAFVARVRSRAPWSAVDALWADPPRSSEQVLHPEKYDARERPVAVPLPALPDDLKRAWRVAADDVLGELGARTWFATAVPVIIAERAAAGWGGDHAALFVPAAEAAPDAGVAPGPFVVWSTVWDDLTDAEDFARAAGTVLVALARGAAADADDDPHRFVARGPGGVFALAWRGASVGLLVGAPEAALGALDELVGKASERKRASSPRLSPAKRGRGSP
jgi:hypothetical protein